MIMNTWDYTLRFVAPRDHIAILLIVQQGSSHWDNNFCKADSAETQEKARNAKAVPIPEHDPISGLDGPLTAIWKEALTKAG